MSAEEPGVPGVGKTVALNANGARIVYFLCAHVRGSEWLCHKGSLIDGALAENPFAEQDLICKDIDAEAWDTSISKRLRSVGFMMYRLPPP